MDANNAEIDCLAEFNSVFNTDLLGHLDEPRPAVDAGAKRDEVVSDDADVDRVAVSGDGRGGAGVVYLADLGSEGVADETGVPL